MAITSEQQQNTSNGWNLMDALLIGIASSIFIFAGIFVIGVFTENGQLQNSLTTNSSYPFVVLLAALEGIGLFFGILILGILRRKINQNNLGFLNVGKGLLIKSAAIALLMMPIIGLIAALIQWILGRPIYNPQLEFIVPDKFSLVTAGAMLLVTGFIVPVAEELYFRAVLYQALRKHFGVWIGALISSLIFGALHGEISIAGATFVMGLVLVYFFEISGSIWPSVLIHVLNNSLKLVAIYIMLAFGININ